MILTTVITVNNDDINNCYIHNDINKSGYKVAKLPVGKKYK